MCRLEIKDEEPRPERGPFNSYRYVHPVSVNCPHCGFKKVFDWDFDTVKRKVHYEIERRIRTGEYRKQVKSSESA